MTLKTAGGLSVGEEESIEYSTNLMRGIRRMSTCNRLDLQTRGSQPIMLVEFDGYHFSIGSVVGENRQLVTDTPVEFEE